MLVRPHDAARSEREWLDFLATHDFGQLVVPGKRELPVIVPTHFVMASPREAIMHFAAPNPVFDALAESPKAALAVVGDYAFIPGTWNKDEDAPEGYGIPTSYYGAVQLAGEAQVVDGGEEMARILTAMMAHFQLEGGYAKVEPGANYFGKHFRAIRGVGSAWTISKPSSSTAATARAPSASAWPRGWRRAEGRRTPRRGRGCLGDSTSKRMKRIS